MRHYVRERTSSALLSEPATTEDLIETLAGRDYKVIECNRIESCLEKKWIARIAHQSRPDQILENENIWLHGFEVSFITGEDEVQFLPKSPLQQGDGALDQWSDNSSTLGSSSGAWFLSSDEPVQPIVLVSSGLAAEMADFWDIQPEQVADLPLCKGHFSEEEDESGNGTCSHEEEQKLQNKGCESGFLDENDDPYRRIARDDIVNFQQDESKYETTEPLSVGQYSDQSDREIEKSSREEDTKYLNTELRVELSKVRQEVMKLLLEAKKKFKTKNAFLAAAEDQHVRELNKSLLEKNEQLEIEISAFRENKKEIRKKTNVLLEKNEWLKKENSKLKEELCGVDST